jgi:hypothetical protein
MNHRARILFIAGSAGLALGGVLHLFGQFGGGDHPLPRVAVEAAMRAYTFRMLGMTFSLMDVMQSWGICFGSLAIFGGVQNLVSLSLLPRSAGIGALAATSALATGVIVALGIAYHIAPPVVVFGLVFLLFAAATVLSFQSGPAQEGQG